MSYPHPHGGPPLPFPAPPLARGRNETPSNGTGYGGDARADTAKRKAGRKLAEKNQDEVAKLQLSELVNVNKCMAKSPPSDAVLDTLKRVLRNSADWSNRSKLYQAALHSCQLLLEYYPRQLGQMDQDDSVLAALQELAQTCAVFLKHSSRDASPQAGHVTLAQRALGVRDEALQMAKRFYKTPELSMVDPQELYRRTFRRHAFDFVPTLVNHAYEKQAQQIASLPQKKLVQELTTYATSLPIEYGSSILVRAAEGNMNLLRVLIFGPDDTPYANGCFVFDVYLQDYPNKPPLVKFLTTGQGMYRFNPNLYKDGKVCLSLLGTWSGPGWQRGESTLLQVLVSIQSLILVDDPYFNEPGYQNSRGTPHGTRQSQEYNAQIRQYTMDAAILPFLEHDGGPYPEFRQAVLKHYDLKRFVLQQQWTKWLAQGPRLLQHLHSRFLVASQTTTHASSNLKRKAAAAAAVAAARVQPSLPSVVGLINIDDDDEGDNQSKPPGWPRRSKQRRAFDNNEVVDLT
jgi:ubiquitin-protein ligase